MIGQSAGWTAVHNNLLTCIIGLVRIHAFPECTIYSTFRLIKTSITATMMKIIPVMM